MAVTVWFDFTCEYSYRVSRWLEHVDVDVRWRTFSLKEVNRPDGAASVFDAPTASATLLALVLAQAADEADGDAYRRAVFAAIHAEERRLSVEDVRAIAAEAGVDLAAFDEQEPRWRAQAAERHAHARDAHRVFGTPTVVLAEDASVFLKLTEPPRAEDAQDLWDSLRTLAVRHPELVELKRS